MTICSVTPVWAELFREEGMREGMREVIRRVMETRFGALDAATTEAIGGRFGRRS